MIEIVRKSLERGMLVDPDIELGASVNILESFEERNTKKSTADFVRLYLNRFHQLQAILKQRQDMVSVTAIKHTKTMAENETATVIGMVLEKAKTKNDNHILTLEDPTGTIKAIITKANGEVYSMANNLSLDQVVGIRGQTGKDVIFVKSITLPDIPLGKEYKKSPTDEQAVFISDVHFGSNVFLKEEFERFIAWINSMEKVKYLFILGDLVEGVGIFPGQEKELIIKDIYEQYSKFSEYIEQINPKIKIIIAPGNHDAVRVAEPQPNLSRLLPNLAEKKNISFVSSPSIVKIGQTPDFPGFDILIYHGFSFPYYASNIEEIRTNGGLSKTEEIMEYLLKARHLAPAHGSTQYQLGYDLDPLVIKSAPDFFVTGHIHRCSVKNYRNTTLLNCSCWISQTDYQEKRGLMPQPAKAVLVNLKTREVEIVGFEK
jgi:DNA polymerase II small subunit